MSRARWRKRRARPAWAWKVLVMRALTRPYSSAAGELAHVLRVMFEAELADRPDFSIAVRGPRWSVPRREYEPQTFAVQVRGWRRTGVQTFERYRVVCEILVDVLGSEREAMRWVACGARDARRAMPDAPPRPWSTGTLYEAILR